MSNEMRNTGIPVFGNVTWGSHVCHYFETRKDLIDILIPYFRAGLENNECCLWLIFDPLTKAGAEEALRRAVPEVDRHLAAGDIEIVPYAKWHPEDGAFSAPRVIASWKGKLALALEKGYAGLRGNVNDAWLAGKDLEAFTQYERELSDSIADLRMILLCSYPLASRTACEIFEVAFAHRQAIARRRGKWDVLKPTELSLAVEKMTRLSDDLEQRVIERTAALEAANQKLRREMSDRRRAENQLGQQKEILQKIFDHIPVMINFVDESGRIKLVNREWERVLGWTLDEILSRNLDIFALCYPDPAERESVLKFVSSSHGVWSDFKTRAKDGRVIETSWADVHLSDGTSIGIGQDITERKRGEEALRESEQRFRQLAKNVRDVFWMSTSDFKRVLYVSPAYESVWGRSRESLYLDSGSLITTIHPEDRQRVADCLAQRPEREFELEYLIVRPDGSIRWIRDRGFPVRDQTGRVYRFAGIAEDLTERIQMEAALRESQKMEALGLLAGGVAHDFNNILTAIVGNATMMLENLDDTKELRENISEVIFASQRAAGLTAGLLSFSRRQVNQPEPLDLNEAVQAMLCMVRRLIGENITLHANLDPNLARVMADPGLVDQIILNLVVNAKDAMPNGGTLWFETTNVEIGDGELRNPLGYPDGRYATMSIRDSGHGMNEETLSHVFEPFFTTKERGKGTGLGLSTVYGIVKQTNGYVSVESRPGEGATFKIYLPALAGAEAIAARETSSTVDPARGGNESILLLEDDPEVRRTVRTILARLGYTVLEAGHPEEARRMIREEHLQVDVLLTDVVMPTTSGPALANELMELMPGLKVLYMSGYTDELIGQHGVLEAEIAFIRKPFTPEALAAKIRHVLG